MLGGLLVLGGVIVLIGGAWHAGIALSSCTDKQARFERTYATVSEHIVEFAFWCYHHIRVGATAQSGRMARILRAGLALFLVILMLAIPVAAIAATGNVGLGAHGLAAGIGALIWGVVLETSSLPQRIGAFSSQYTLQPEPWLWAILLCVSDAVVLGATAGAGIGDANIKAAMIGISYVAAADLISTYVGFVLCPWNRYPLGEP